MGYLKNELTGFVPVEQATDIIKMVTRGSSVLRMAKVEEMKHEKKKFNVLTDGPGAYWVGEGERIKTSGATWIHPEIEAKKLAVIIPVTKEKLEDTTISVFEELKPEIAEAFYRAIDAACIFGTNSPFKTNIMNAIDSKHMVVTVHKIQGIGAGFVPHTYNGKLVDKIIRVKDDDAIRTGDRKSVV